MWAESRLFSKRQRNRGLESWLGDRTDRQTGEQRRGRPDADSSDSYRPDAGTEGDDEERQQDRVAREMVDHGPMLERSIVATWPCR